MTPGPRTKVLWLGVKKRVTVLASALWTTGCGGLFGCSIGIKGVESWFGLDFYTSNLGSKAHIYWFLNHLKVLG